MTRQVMLSLRGEQRYMDQEPDVIELVTEGTLKKVPTGWELVYEESSLTGLEGVSHDSLYQMEFGALMIRVCASRICWDLSPDGGTVDLKYAIEIEQSAAGTVDYHLEIKSK